QSGGRRVDVFRGSAQGLSTLPIWSKSGGGFFGAAVDGALDLNGDGFADLVVTDLVGATAAYAGSPSGPRLTPVLTVEEPFAFFARGGDVNGDGVGDLVGEIDGGPISGVFAYYGGASGSHGLRLPGQLRTDGAGRISPLGSSDSLTGVRLRSLGRSAAG